jgi:hypothetical protein
MVRAWLNEKLKMKDENLCLLSKNLSEFVDWFFLPQINTNVKPMNTNNPSPNLESAG